MMTPIQRKAFRKLIGNGVMEAQEYAKQQGFEVDEVLQEIMSALLSLSANIALNNAGLRHAEFMQLCMAATADEVNHALARS